MTINCDPCVCPEQWYRNIDTWRKGVIKVLCNLNTGIANIVLGAGTNHIGSVSIDPVAATHITEVSKAYSSLSDAAYTAVLANAHALKLITITNTMDVPASISFDGTNPHHTIPAGAGLVLDLVSDGLTAIGNIYALRKVAGATKGEVAVGGMY